MAFRGRGFPRIVNHDYMGVQGYPATPAKAYRITGIDYSPTWPAFAFLPLPQPLNLLPQGSADFRSWETHILVPIIRPAFFLRIDWFMRRGPTIGPNIDDSWNFKSTMTTGFAPIRVWQGDWLALQVQAHNNSFIDIIEDHETNPFQILGFRFEAVPW